MVALVPPELTEIEGSRSSSKPLSEESLQVKAAPLVRDTLQRSRYEIKYRILPQQIPKLRNLVAAHLTPDKFTRGRVGIGYPVHSLYFDSPTYTMFYQTEDGAKNRPKLRIRFYDNSPTAPCFLEVKRKEGEKIFKCRAMVSKQSALELCDYGELPSERDLLAPSEESLKALLAFNRLVAAFKAKPAIFTSYFREGYENDNDNEERMTFDTDVRGGVYRGVLSAADRDQWPVPEQIRTPVFEMKFTDHPPRWMLDIVEIGELQRTSFKKYCSCLAAHRRELFMA